MTWHPLVGWFAPSFRTVPRARGRKSYRAQKSMMQVEALEDRCLLASFAVTNTLENGAGSLHQAILDANGNPGADTITFQIASGPQTIALQSALPNIADSVTIDGTSQPGFADRPLIEIHGPDCSGNLLGDTGLRLTGSNSVVRGLALNCFAIGIELGGQGGHSIVGNFIGTDLTGTAAQGNGVGIAISSSNNIVGGAVASDRNVISGNLAGGVYIGGTSNRIVRNLIGTDVTGTVALGNGGGRDPFGFNAGIQINGNSNVVGGRGPGDGNVIAFNTSEGVRVVNSPNPFSNGNTIVGNSVFSNGLLGIDLRGDGVTANDANDTDEGPNDLQNFPAIEEIQTGANTRIRGSLNAVPNMTFTLDFYASAMADPSGFGEGQRYMGFGEVVTDAGGDASFDITLPAVLAAGEVITATATNTTGNTSEFSTSDETVGTPNLPDLAVQDLIVPSSAPLGEVVTIRWELSNTGVASVPGSWVDSIWLSKDESLDAGDILLRAEAANVAELAPGDLYENSVAVGLDHSDLDVGNYFVLFRTDSEGGIQEVNENNNAASQATTLLPRIRILDCIVDIQIRPPHDSQWKSRAVSGLLPGDVLTVTATLESDEDPLLAPVTLEVRIAETVVGFQLNGEGGFDSASRRLTTNRTEETLVYRTENFRDLDKAHITVCVERQTDLVARGLSWGNDGGVDFRFEVLRKDAPEEPRVTLWWARPEAGGTGYELIQQIDEALGSKQKDRLQTIPFARDRFGAPPFEVNRSPTYLVAHLDGVIDESERGNNTAVLQLPNFFIRLVRPSIFANPLGTAAIHYGVVGGPPPANPEIGRQVAVFWAVGRRRLGEPFQIFENIDTRRDVDLPPLNITPRDFSARPPEAAGATNLLVAIDPNDRLVESREDTNELEYYPPNYFWPDLPVRQLRDGSLEFTYELGGTPLDVSIAGSSIPTSRVNPVLSFYWAQGERFEDRLSSRSIIRPIRVERGLGQQSVQIPARALNRVPAEATHIIGVLDAGGQVGEWIEEDNVIPFAFEAPCDLRALNEIKRALPATKAEHDWNIGSISLSEDDGLVLRDISFGGRYMASEFSLPYFVVKTTTMRRSQRFELKPCWADSLGRSRLVAAEVTTDGPQGLVISASYEIDRLPNAGNSVLRVTQQYEFRREADISLDPTQACEPSGQPCVRFAPRVIYTFIGDGSSTLQEVQFPERLEFLVNGEQSNTAGVFQDCDDVPYCGFLDLQTSGLEFRNKENPLEREMYGVAIDHGNPGGWDNYHQTFRDNIGEPFTALVPGCTECVHIHWRWSNLANASRPLGNPDFANYGGRPIISEISQVATDPELRQSVDFAVVRWSPREKERDPVDFRKLVGRQPLIGQRLVFWYRGKGHLDTDEFFVHGGFFSRNSASLESNIRVTQSASADQGHVGEALTYSVHLTSHGPDVEYLDDVRVTSVLPENVTLISAGATQGVCTNRRDARRRVLIVECGVPLTLRQGFTEEITIVILPQQAGTLLHAVTVRGTLDDPDFSDNSSTLHISVLA